MIWWPTPKVVLTAGAVAVGSVIGVVAGVGLTGRSAPAAETPARAWIDQPSDGAALPLASIVITAHATDADGVDVLSLLVDGAVVHEERPAIAPTLLVAEARWDPPGPGRYEIVAVGRDPSGAEGVAATATVVVIGATPDGSTSTSSTLPSPSSTPDAGSTTTSPDTTSPLLVGTTVRGTTIPASATTTAPTTSSPITTPPVTTGPPTTLTSTSSPPSTSPPTTRPTTTSPRVTTTTRPPATTTTTTPSRVTTTTATPTTTTTTTLPCAPSVPILTSPGDDEFVPTRTPALSWAYRGCGPASFTVQVADNDLFLSGRALYVRSVQVGGASRSIVWEPLVCGRTHYWRALGTDAAGSSAWAPTRSFFTDC